MYTAWKLSNYGVFFGLYFLVFGLSTEKYGPEKTPYLDTFHEVVSILCKVYGTISISWFSKKLSENVKLRNVWSSSTLAFSSQCFSKHYLLLLIFTPAFKKVWPIKLLMWNSFIVYNLRYGSKLEVNCQTGWTLSIRSNLLFWKNILR